jgi:ferredoxin-NADP reductase
MSAVLLMLGAYRRLATTPLAPAINPPHPVRRTGFELGLTVAARRPVADDVLSLSLVSPEGAQLPSWRPGAHLDVFLPSGRQRQYSLNGDPADRYSYRIAVRLIADGGGGSREIHETVHAGDRLRIRGPRNAFRLVDAPSYHFVAGGIGITPILPMLKAVDAMGAPWRLIYTGRSAATMPFLDELPHRNGDVVIRPDDEFGVPEPAHLLAGLEHRDAVYVCGPPPMLDGLRVHFGTEIRELHSERFSAPAVVGGEPFEVELRRSGLSVRVGATESVLAAVRRVRPEVPYSCQQGFCGSCKTRVVAGRVDHRDHLLLDESRADSMLICVSRCAGPLVLDI